MDQYVIMPRANLQMRSLLSITLLLAGCDKQSSVETTNASMVPAVTQPAMTAWEQGDTPAAIAGFVEADWSSEPLFPANSPLRLSESQFVKLSAAERQSKSAEMMPQIDRLKRLAAAVANAGREAAANGDTAQAQKHFTALKQCGAALEGPGHLRLVQLVGHSIRKSAEAELAKLGG